MTRVFNWQRWGLVTAIVASAVPTASAAVLGPPCSYSVIQVPAPVCPVWGVVAVTPDTMNVHGQWVGSRLACDLSHTLAVFWSPQGGLTSLPTPPGTISSGAGGINDWGMVVGHRNNIACRWQADGSFALLPGADSGEPSGASAVNNAGLIAGWMNSFEGSAIRWAVVWDGEGYAILDPTEFGGLSAEALDVSDAGVVVGILDDHGFRWEGRKITHLPPLPGATSCRALAVNDDGYTVGDSKFLDVDDGTSYFLPVVWDSNGIPSTLPLLSGYAEGGCIDVNNSGVVLGSVSAPSVAGLPSHQPVLWIGGNPIAIRPLIDPPSGNSFNAFGLNENLLVLGKGPVSPPGGSGVWILIPEIVECDLDQNCTVDGADLMALLENWGTASGGAARGDFDGDGQVDGADLGRLLGEWTEQ